MHTKNPIFKYMTIIIIVLFVNIVSLASGNGKTVSDGNDNLPERSFAGLNFGVGVSLTIDFGKHDRVRNAEIVNGIVRVSQENNANARVMLESHYFFTPNDIFGIIPFNKLDPNEPDKYGIGPFLALQPGTDEIIEAIGLGVMLGCKRKAPDKGSWNIGVGVVVDPHVQILGDGFKENAEPPNSETIVRYKETEQWGIVILASFAF